MTWKENESKNARNRSTRDKGANLRQGAGGDEKDLKKKARFSKE